MRNKIQAFVEIVVGILAMALFLFSVLLLSWSAANEINLVKQTFKCAILAGVIIALFPDFPSVLNGIRMRFLFLVGKKWTF